VNNAVAQDSEHEAMSSTTTTPKSPRLGKGLAALMGEMPAAASSAPSAVRAVGIDLLEPNPFQPRTDMPEAELAELSESIKVQGILQPILVRPHPTEEGRYQIIAGERRWRASGLAGLHEVPVYVRSLSDSDVAAAALVENLQRQDLNPIEEAEGLRRLIEDFHFTHEAMGHAISKSRSHISNMLRLLNLPQEVQINVREGKLTYAHARSMLKHPDPAAIMPKVINRGLSVRQTEQLIVRDTMPKPGGRKKIEKDANLRSFETEMSDATGMRVRLLVSPDGAGQITITVDNWLQIEDIKARLTGA
jgi:ParB family chromosome partitioning protein